MFPQSDSVLPLQQERALGGALDGRWLFGVLILGRFADPSSAPTPTSLFTVTVETFQPSAGFLLIFSELNQDFYEFLGFYCCCFCVQVRNATA